MIKSVKIFRLALRVGGEWGIAKFSMNGFLSDPLPLASSE